MRLVERHIINKNHISYNEIDSICFLAKNLYNKANYIIRQEFFLTSKEKEAGLRDHAIWIRYGLIQKQLQNDNDFDYIQLPRKVSQQILRVLDKNWKSFFESVKDWVINPEKYLGRPKPPRYKHKTKGRVVLAYTQQAISKKEIGIGLSGTQIKISTQQTNIQQVRIVPKISNYVIEIIYKKEVEDLNLNKNNIAGIDMGLDNLAAITSNVNEASPLIINGRPLKSLNQYYNKEKAKLQSFVGDKTSHRLNQLTNKRNRKVDDYLHKSSRMIVNHCIKNNIGTIVIGYNEQWKTEINLGRRNNQAFINIPHARFIQMIKYKCRLVGIEVKLTEESYTSKCSFIDFESLERQDKYVGKRIFRGLFISKENKKINADCNGSGNIIRKVIPSAFDGYGIEGVVVHPVRVTPYKQVA